MYIQPKEPGNLGGSGRYCGSGGGGRTGGRGTCGGHGCDGGWLVVDGEMTTDMEVGALGDRWDTIPKTYQRQSVKRDSCTAGSYEWSYTCVRYCKICLTFHCEKYDCKTSQC